MTEEDNLIDDRIPRAFIRAGCGGFSGVEFARGNVSRAAAMRGSDVPPFLPFALPGTSQVYLLYSYKTSANADANAAARAWPCGLERQVLRAVFSHQLRATHSASSNRCPAADRYSLYSLFF